MVTQYPSKLDNNISLPEVVDLTTIYSADVYNRLRNAIIAIETELGVSPASVYTTVRNRFLLLEDDISNLQIITLTNDLGGTLDLPKVIGIQGTPVSTTSPTINQALVFNGASWAPANLAEGSFAFTASGDLDGTELLQTVIGLQGRPLADTAPNDGEVVIWDSGGSTWKPGTVNSFTAGGDLAGDNTTQTVTALQGYDVATTAPTDGYILTWEDSSTSWKPLAAPVGFSAGGDLTGSESSQQVVTLTGVDGIVNVPTAALTFGTDTVATAGLIRMTGDASNTNPQFLIRDISNTLDRCVIHATETVLSLGGDYNQAKEFNSINVYATTAVGLGTGGTTKLYVTSTGVNIYDLTSALTFGYTGAAATGTIRLKNTDSIKSLNFAGGADYILAGTDVSDNLFLGGNVDGTQGHPQVFISPASFGFLRAGGSNAMLWTATNLLFSQPAIGYNTQYGVHGGVVFAFLADSNYTVDAAVYQYDWNEFTVGAWTGTHSVIYPAPASKDRGYYKTIFNNTIYAITVSVGSGNTQSLAAGITRRFWFDDSGVSIAGITNGISALSISPGTNGYVLSTVSGVATWTVQTPRQFNITLAAGVQTTTSTAFIRAGARQIDMTPYPATIGALTRTVTFVADIDKSSGATTVEVQLYDTTHTVAVTGTDLTSASNSNAAVSAVVTVGSNSGNLRDDNATQYELQFKMNGGGGSDAVTITNARLVITYA